MPTIQEAVAAAAPGDTVTIAAGVYDVSGLVLPSGITLQAAGNATIVGNLTIVGADTVVRGFTFAGGSIDIAQSQGTTIADCVFNGGPTSIVFDGARGATITNNAFNDVTGAVIGGWGLDQSTISGNRFVDCRQPIDLHFNNDPTHGRDITVDHNMFSGTTRMPIEVGPAGAYTANLVIRDNWSDSMNNSGPDPDGSSTAVAYSIIATNGVNTLITGNYAKGPGGESIGIELDGPGEITGNAIEGFAFGTIVYGSGFNVHHNAFLDTPLDTVLNFSGADGIIENNTSDAAHFNPPPPPLTPVLPIEDGAINWTLLSPAPEPHGDVLLPTYGFYGGPNYSDGIVLEPGAAASFTHAPLDALDAAYQAHDLAYESPSPQVRATADIALLDAMLAIGDDQLGPEGHLYAAASTFAILAHLGPYPKGTLTPEQFGHLAASTPAYVADATASLADAGLEPAPNEQAALASWLTGARATINTFAPGLFDRIAGGLAIDTAEPSINAPAADQSLLIQAETMAKQAWVGDHSSLDVRELPSVLADVPLVNPDWSLG